MPKHKFRRSLKRRFKKQLQRNWLAQLRATSSHAEFRLSCATSLFAVRRHILNRGQPNLRMAFTTLASSSAAPDSKQQSMGKWNDMKSGQWTANTNLSSKYRPLQSRTYTRLELVAQIQDATGSYVHATGIKSPKYRTLQSGTHSRLELVAQIQDATEWYVHAIGTNSFCNKQFSWTKLVSSYIVLSEERYAMGRCPTGETICLSKQMISQT
jgi:hypothetical protein